MIKKKDLLKRIEKLELDLYQLKNPFKFDIGEEAFIDCNGNFKKVRIFNRDWGTHIYSYNGYNEYDSSKKYYSFIDEFGQSYMIGEEKIFTLEQIKNKFSNIKDDICDKSQTKKKGK